MNLKSIVWKELWQRPAALAASLIVVLIAVAAFVAMRQVTEVSQREVARQLDTLGANILILPNSASLQDYYAADVGSQTLPEEHVSEIMLAGLTGVEKVSPKLSMRVELQGKPVVLTGILPQSEFQTKASWQSLTLLKKKHAGCKKVSCGPAEANASPEALATDRTIQDLRQNQVVVGCDVAARLKLESRSSIELLGQKFTVLAVLPATGTVDDSRVFAHLHAVQKYAKCGEVVSAIEVLGCCEDAAGQLVPELRKLLPDAKIVTISQVVETQVGVNRMMSKSMIFVLVVLALVGGASVMSSIASNVRERRREIGTLLALGATPRLVLGAFLLKALWLGVAGGLGGCLIGTVLAAWLGPLWTGVPVLPQFDLLVVTIAATIGIALVSAYGPAYRAAQTDPCICFREI